MLSLNRKEVLGASTPICDSQKSLSNYNVAALAGAFIILLMAALLVLPGCSSSSSSSSSTSASGNSNSEIDAVKKAEVGDVVKFGDYEWRVLAKENGKALVITNDIIDVKPYNDNRDDVTWETCSLRTYLNGEFYDSFGDSQKKAISETKNANPDNPSYGTPGGNETTDKIFCLSMDEAEQYFADDDDRIANYNDGKSAWWLRTPGSDTYIISYVAEKGDVSVSGHFADYTKDGMGGIRPAMWVNC